MKAINNTNYTSYVDSPFYVAGAVPPTQISQHFHARGADRDELLRVLTRGRPPRRLLLGSGGRGKTSLANAIRSVLPRELPQWGINLSRISPATPWNFWAQLGDMMGADWPDLVAQAEARGDWVTLIPPFRKRAARGGQLLLLDDAQGLEAFPADFARALVSELREDRKLPMLILSTRATRLLTEFETHELAPFTDEEARSFLEDRFRRGSLQPRPDVLDAIAEVAQGEPELLQQIGHRLWEDARLHDRKTLTNDDLADVLSQVLDRLSPQRAALFGEPTGQTRDLLVAMALHEEHRPTALAARVGLEPKNAVVLLARAAHRTGLIERRRRGQYEFRDPLFKAYLKKEYSTAQF